MKGLLRNILISIFLLFVAKAFSQTYPVQTFVQVSPPHTSYLPDYSDPFSNQMKIFLTLTDFTVPSYQVKLRFTLTGNGYSITTSSLLNLPTTTLSPGSPVEISGSDLAPYLSSQNLLFSGIDVTDYEIRKVLPEGPCQICVEVIDFSNPNQAVLSNPACTQVWFSLNDPPLLNTPFCGNQITPTDPQQLIFSWTPLHMNSLHSAGTNYVFELFEIRPNGADPNQVVNSSLPIFMQVTDQTFINYGITEPQLQTGMSYVWRVRAQDIQGRDFFRNNGYSAVCTFTYGNIAESLADGITLTLNTAGTGTRKGDAWWNVSATFTNYKLEVRKTGNPDYEWFPYESTNGELKIYQLEPATQYECRVKGLIGTEYESEWSNISVFTTQPLIDYACGSTTQPPGEINFTPLTNAIAGLTFEIGQFELLVTDIEPLDPILQPGHYRGTGKIAVGFAIINIRVSFDDILVDDNLKVRSGKVEAITEGMDAWLAGTTEPDYYVDGTITDFEWSDSTSLTVWVDGVPQTFSFAEHDPLVIQDEDGMVYSFNSDGTYTVISILIYSNDVLAGTADYRIDFSKDQNQIYGFDKKEYAAWLHDYEVIRLLDSTNYFVSYKSLAPDETDYVIANITSENPLSNVTFVAQTLTGTTNLASQQINDSTYRVTLAGMNSSFYVYAEDDGNRIGKLWVKVLPSIEKEIVFVPVNGASLSQITEIENELNEIYIQANVSFEVTTKSNYQSSTWDIDTDGKLQTGDVDLMSHYSEEMRLLRDEYFASDTGYNKNAYYIFIIPEFLQEDLGGYMVRGKGVGFLKNGESPRTAAHELAHGIFALEHTFPAIEEGSTENLLDYSATGKHLAQKQWYYMHNPLPAFSFLDDEEEGSYTYSEKFEKLLQLIRCAYSNNENEISNFSTYMSGIDKYIVFNYGVEFNQNMVNGTKITRAFLSIPENQSTLKGILSYTINSTEGLIQFQNFSIKVDIYSYPQVNPNGITPFQDFIAYLFPTRSDVEDDFTLVKNSIQNKISSGADLNNYDITKIKKIASCGSEFLTVEERFWLISVLVDFGLYTDEKEEDLILDLVSTLPEGEETEFLQLFRENLSLFDALCNGMDNVQLNFFGNENNVDRFVYEIFKIWSRSEFALVDNELYTYSTNSPGILSIHPLNPNASYTFEMNGTTLISELETSWNTAHEIPEEWSFSHDIFQPIMTNIEGSNSWKLPSIPFPAFILNVSKNAADIETTLAGCNFVLDIALTFSGVGSLTKLSMIPSKFRLFKATIATVEIGSSLADLLMNHSDMCVGQEELCKKWKVLTFSLQLFSLTGDVLIRNSIKKYTRDYLDELYKTGNDIPTNTKNQLTLIAEESILETLKKRLQDAGISDMSIVNQLDNWNNGTLNKLYQITADPNYVGLLNEFVSDVSLLDKFRLVEETWWAKYPMAGLCKRTGSTVPTQFKKYIGDIEVTPTVGGKLNLRDAEVLDHLSSQYIGKLFDDEMAYQIKNSWISGDFTNFPPNIADYLKDLHLKNYKLVIEPQVSILDENPKPDLLFFGSKKVGSITKTDVIYLEVKYLSDVPFTNPQKAILNNLPATVIEKNSNELRDNVTNEILVLQGQSFVINEAHKLTVNKNTFQMEIQ